LILMKSGKVSGKVKQTSSASTSKASRKAGKKTESAPVPAQKPIAKKNKPIKEPKIKEPIAKKNNPIKEPITLEDAAITVLLETLFGTVALFEFSLLLWAHWKQVYAFVAVFYLWKSQAPFLGQLLTLLHVVIPFALYNLTKEGIFGLFTKKATSYRHALDTIKLLALVAVLTINFGFAGAPEEELVQSLGLVGTPSISLALSFTAKATDPTLAPNVEHLLYLKGMVLCSHLVLVLLPFLRIWDSQKPTGKAKTA